MTLQIARTSTSASANPVAAESPISSAVFDGLAARIRPAGIFLAVADADGTVTQHDAAAEPVFLKYVLPFLKRQQSRSPVGQQARSLVAAPASKASELPGFSVVTVPFTEKRQTVATFVLIGKADGFAAGEDVQRACSQLGIDAGWLFGAAKAVPAYAEEAMIRQGNLLLAMVRDSVKLSGLEREVDTLSGQLANTYEELSLIYQISGGMKVNRGAADFFRQSCLDVLNVMEVRGMGAVLGDGIVDRPTPAVYGGIDIPADVVAMLHDRIMATLVQRKSSVIVRDVAADPEFAFFSEYATQILAVPLQRQEEVLGGLFAIDKQEGDFDSVDSKLLTSIANESAIYLENAKLFEDVNELMMGLLHSLTSAVDAKDAYTCGHSTRVALVSRHIAAQMGLPDRDVKQIYMAGLLHDVGKIGVPEAVLQKAGRLTTEEFELIKRHPGIGAKILQDVKQIREIIPGVLHHHERYDGKGYPAGLAGSDIPLMGRIICLADCFDAMTSSRTYRRGMPLEVAMAEIRRCAGTQFDPAVAEVFLKTKVAVLQDMLSDKRTNGVRLRELQDTIRAA